MKEPFFVYCDGASRGNPGPSASAYLIFSNQRRLVAKGGRFWGKGTNNEAEYRAVVLALEHLKKLKVKKAIFFLDSLLVAKQLSGDFKVRNERMQKFFIEIKRLIWETKMEVEFRYVSRAKNVHADKLVNEFLDQAQTKSQNGKF